MDGAEALRAVRRREGLSQRALAVRSGVALSTITAVEAGRRSPSLAVLAAVVAVAGLELAVDRAVPAVPAATVVHLRRSLEQRLHLACGGDGRLRAGKRPPAWRDLRLLAARGPVHLHGAAARALWLRGEGALPVEVCADVVPARPPHGTPTRLVEVRPSCHRHVQAPVDVGLDRRRIWVDPPADLALDAEHAARRGELRAVARLLHQDAPVDDSGRRPRAHRDPAHQREREKVFHTKRFHHLDMPPSDDTRSWRLDDDASLAAWLRRFDHPV